MNKKISGRPPLSAVARKCIIPVERLMLASILHSMDLVRVAQSVRDEIRAAAAESAAATGASPNAATLPPPSFTPSHSGFVHLKTAWSSLYQLQNAYLTLARLEKKYMDILCTANESERKTEICGYDNKQLTELLELKRVLTETATIGATEAADPSPAAPAAIPAIGMNVAKHQQLVEKLLALVETDRAAYAAKQQGQTALTKNDNNGKTEEKEAEQKNTSAAATPAVNLSLDWPDAFRVAGAPFMSRAFMLLELRPAAATWSTVLPEATGSLITRSISEISVPEPSVDGDSGNSSATGSPKLTLGRSLTDIRGGVRKTSFSSDADGLPLLRSNSMSRTNSSVQRQLMSSASVKNLPSMGQSVAGSKNVSRTNSSGTSTTAAGTSDIAQSLTRWKSWQRSNTSPRGSISGLSAPAPSDPSRAFSDRLQVVQRFLASSLDPHWVTAELAAHRAEADSRVEGMRVLYRALSSVLPSERPTTNATALDSPSLEALDSLLLGLGECIRGRWQSGTTKAARSDSAASGPHYLNGIEGVGVQVLAEVRSAFTVLLSTFARLLQAPASQVRATTKMLILTCVSLVYQSPQDISLLRDSHLLQSIYKLFAADDTIELSRSAAPTPLQSLAACARTLFCQLVTIVQLWSPSGDAALDASLAAVQEEVLTFLLKSIRHEAARLQAVPGGSAATAEVTVSFAEAGATAEKPKTTPHRHDDALYAYLLLLHTLRSSPAVKKFLASTEVLQTMLTILHLNTARLDTNSAAAGATILASNNEDQFASAATLRIQRLLLRLIRSMLASSSDVVSRLLQTKQDGTVNSAEISSNQRVFVSALFDRIGELLSGGAAHEAPSALTSPTHAGNSPAPLKIDESKTSITVDKPEEKKQEFKEGKEEEEKNNSLAADAAASPSPSPEAPTVSSDSAEKDHATYSLTVHNGDPDNVAGAQFAANLYSAAKDILKSIARPPSASASTGGSTSSKGDYRTQLSSSNVAVLMSGSRDDCSRIGKLLSSRGFVISMNAIPPSDGLVRNLVLARSNPSYFLSASVALALTLEFVTLLQILGSSSLWKSAVEGEILARVEQLSKVTPSTEGPAMSASLAVLSVLSGFRDQTLRAGSKVIVQSLDAQEASRELAAAASADSSALDSGVLNTATVIRCEAGKKNVVVVMDQPDGTPAQSATTILASRLRPVSQNVLLQSDALVQPKIIDSVLSFLQSALTSSATASADHDLHLLHQELVLYALRFISSVMAHQQHSRTLLKRADLLKLLINSAKKCPAASCGFQASASHMAQLELESARLRERWLDLHRPVHWRNSDVDAQHRLEMLRQRSASSTEEKSMHKLLPYQPHSRTAAGALPTSVAIDNGAKYLILETAPSAKSTRSATAIVQFTREQQCHIPADFLLGLGGRGLDSRSGNSLRRLEEQLRIEAQSMGIGDGDYCVLGNAAIDLTLPEYYFEVTLLSSHPISIGLSPRIPVVPTPASGVDADSQDSHAGGRQDRHRGQDPGLLLQSKLQQLLRARMNLWPMQSVRLQSKDGRVIRKLSDAPNVVAGKDEVKSYTAGWGSEGEVIGVHWNLIDGSVAFTKNGKSLGPAFTLSMGSRPASSPSSSTGSGSASSSVPLTAKLYPAVSMTHPGTRVSFNFGASPFMYKLPKQSAIVESEDAKAERMRRAEEADRIALQREQEAATRREVERVALEASRAETAQSIMDMVGPN